MSAESKKARAARRAEENQQVLCAACGTRRDQHGQAKHCARFVKSKIVDKPMTASEVGISYVGIDMSKDPMYQKWKDMWDQLLPYYPGMKQYKGVPARGGGKSGWWQQMVGRMDRNQTYDNGDPVEPVYHRAAAGKIDYTEWVDEEDCLTDTTRGGMRPPKKGRIIF